MSNCLVKVCDDCGHAFVVGKMSIRLICPADHCSGTVRSVRDHAGHAGHVGPMRLPRKVARAMAADIREQRNRDTRPILKARKGGNP